MTRNTWIKVYVSRTIQNILFFFYHRNVPAILHRHTLKPGIFEFQIPNISYTSIVTHCKLTGWLCLCVPGPVDLLNVELCLYTNSTILSAGEANCQMDYSLWGSMSVCFNDLFCHKDMTIAQFHWLFMSHIGHHRFNLIDLTVMGKWQ